MDNTQKFILLFISIGFASKLVAYTPPTTTEVSELVDSLSLIVNTMKFVNDGSDGIIQPDQQNRSAFQGGSHRLCTGEVANFSYICGKGFQFVFLLHGWRGSELDDFPQELKNAICEADPQTVVVIFDWWSTARNNASAHYFETWIAWTSYPSALQAANTIGEAAADAIERDFLKGGCTTFDHVHLIGHSLGAIAFLKTAEKLIHVGRFTALDPPGWMFLLDLPVRFKSFKGVAKFVDVWHSSVLSARRALGDVDIFINNALYQPGCPDPTGLSYFNYKLEIGNMVKCTHGRVYYVYAESLRNHFWAYPCTVDDPCDIPFRVEWQNICNTSNLINVGYNSPKSSGLMFLPTGCNTPFSFVGCR